MTFIDPSLRALLKKAEQQDSYWVEKAKLEFAVALHRRCRLAGISNAQLAKKLGTSAAYVTKVFRGDTNFTIETMVKLARAAGAALNFQFVDEAAKALSEPARASVDAINVATTMAITVSSARDLRLDLSKQELADQRQPSSGFIELKAFEGGAYHA